MLDTRHFVVRSLLADGVIVDADVRRASEHAVSRGGDILESLVSLNIVQSRKMAIARAKICEYPFVDLSHYEVDFGNCRLIPRSAAERLGVFPLFVLPGCTTVAMLDPLNLQAIDQVRQLIKTDVDPVLADPEQLRSLIARAYSMSGSGDDAAVTQAAGDEALTTGDEPIVAAVNQIISGAADAGASDVHINPDENELRLRYRVDGVLQVQQGPAKNAHTSMVQRLKVLAKLDLTQTRKPQDGKFRFVHRGEPIDIRLSLLPTIHGENVVMRLLRAGGKIGPLSSLQMPTEMTKWYEAIVAKPHGLILVTGPTGSGKTTTIYTALHHLNHPSRNIVTIEDPVEIRLPVIRQVQTNSEIGLTFAAALRSVLRQDPDVVLVGEIRDLDTAKIAVQAAMTGHLVFSTLHTNDAIGAIERLREMEVPAFAVNGSLQCVIAQRLVRKLCPTCSKDGPEPEYASMVPPDYATGAFKFAVGCGACRNTGYRGRLGAYEMLRNTGRLQKLIERSALRAEIEPAARLDGMRSMWEDGMEKAARGLTTLSEVFRLRHSSDEGEAAGNGVRIAA